MLVSINCIGIRNLNQVSTCVLFMAFLSISRSKRGHEHPGKGRRVCRRFPEGWGATLWVTEFLLLEGHLEKERGYERR